MKTRNFKEDLLKELGSPNAAVVYLTDAIEQDDRTGFLLAVRDVIEARGGMGRHASKIKSIHRVSLYKALSVNGNPLFSTMLDILDTVGIGLRPYVKRRFSAKRRAA